MGCQIRRSIDYKITGNTQKGRCSCGHISRKGENYYIIRQGHNLYSRCKKCSTDKDKIIRDVAGIGDERTGIK